MSSRSADKPIVLAEGRFERFTRIAWWDQSRLAAARVLVIGAGALGNEVLKNLALLGVGNVAVADMDRIEQSNLCRSVLFRADDEGRFKAVAAAQAAQDLYPDMRVYPLVGNVLADVGLGWFRWADVVVGALDNREARVFVNEACARVGRMWIDGGIDVLNGIVRGFRPPATACYECTMSERDWDVLAKRRSCSLLARKAIAQGGTPTTPTTASVVGAMQAQEVVKALHGLDVLAGRGFVFEGLSHNSYAVSYPVSPDCPWHGPAATVEPADQFDSRTPLSAIWQYAAGRLGGLDAIDLARELVARLDCPACGDGSEVWASIERINEADAICPACGAERTPQFAHSIGPDSPLLDRSPGELGLPPWDVLWARCGPRELGIELSGDRAAAMAD